MARAELLRGSAQRSGPAAVSMPVRLCEWRGLNSHSQGENKMKYSTKVSDAVHIMAYIALSGGCPLPSGKIAESIRTNPGYVRQMMSALRKSGLLSSVKGHPRPALTREPSAITLLDVYKAVEGGKPLLHLDTHTNPECGVGVNIQLALQDYFDQIQQKAEKEMESITLQDILDNYQERIRQLK